MQLSRLPMPRLTAGPKLSSLLVLLSSFPCHPPSFPSPDPVDKPSPARKVEEGLLCCGGLAFSPRTRPRSAPLPDLVSWRRDTSGQGRVLVRAAVGDRRGERAGGDCRLRGGLPLRRIRAGGVIPSLAASRPPSRPLTSSAKGTGVEISILFVISFGVLKGSLRPPTTPKGHSSFCGRLVANFETPARSVQTRLGGGEDRRPAVATSPKGAVVRVLMASSGIRPEKPRFS